MIGADAEPPPPSRGRVWTRRLFYGALAMTTIAYGSASRLQGDIAAMAFALTSLLSLAEPIVGRRVLALRTFALLLATVLAGYAFVQTLPLPLGSPYANAAWGVLDIFGPAQHYISLAPGATRDALPSLLLPFLVFACALSLFQGDDDAIQLWRALAYFGAGCAAFGIFQEVLFPEQLLLEAKKHYVGYLTATFVNRNTAGTFFGVALALNLSLLFGELKTISLSSLLEKAARFDIVWPSRHARVVLQALLCVFAAAALFLTASRGAVGASFAAVTMEIGLFALRPITRDKPITVVEKWRRPAALAVAVAFTFGVFSLFGERSTYRMQESGTGDGRWCAFASTWDAIRDNWRFGAGYAAFQDTFPRYRYPDCAGFLGVWERAHNIYLEGFLGFGAGFAAVAGLGILVLAGALGRGVRKRRRPGFVAVGGAAALVLVLLHGLVDFSLQIPGFNVYFAAAMAAATTVSLGRWRGGKPLSPLSREAPGA